MHMASSSVHQAGSSVARVAIVLVPIVAALFFLALYETYVTRAHPDAVYMDTLRVVYHLDQWSKGRLSLLTLWGFGHEHQGLINQFFVMANIKLFSLNVLLASRLTGIVIFALALTVLATFCHTLRGMRVRSRSGETLAIVAVAVIITAVCFSWAGWELITINLGLSQWVKNLSFVLFFVAHARYMALGSAQRPLLVRGIALGLTGAFIVLFIAMGWSYAFVGAVVFVYAFVILRRFVKREALLTTASFVPLALTVAAQVVYVIASASGVRPTGPYAKFAGLGSVPSLMLYAIGSGTVGQEALQQYSIRLVAAACMGAFAALAALILLYRRLRRDGSGSTVPLYLMAYGALMAFSVSIARGNAGAADVMASRYYPDLMLFYVGLIWLWCEDVTVTNGRARIGSASFLCLLLLAVVAGQALTYVREWGVAPYRAMAFRSMNQALWEGVPNAAAARLLQAPQVYARLGDQIMREEHLALYAKLPAGACDPADVQFLGGWYPRESGGTWMGKTSFLRLPTCHCNFVASVFVPQQFGSRSMTIASGRYRQRVALHGGATTTVRVPPSRDARLLQISVSRTTVPATLEGAHDEDQRNLGAYWRRGYNFSCVTGGSK